MIDETFLHNLYLYIKIAVISMVTFFAPVMYIALTISLLLIAETATGIWASRITPGESVKSYLKKNISKLILYNVSLCLSYMLQIHVLNDVLPLMSLIGFYLCTTEFYSFLNNVKKITGKDILSYAIEKLSDLAQNSKKKSDI